MDAITEKRFEAVFKLYAKMLPSEQQSGERQTTVV